MSVDLSVLSVLPVQGHPRHAKRIEMMLEQGIRVQAVAFERDYHTGRMPPCPCESLGHIAHGRYLARLGTYAKAIPTLRAAIAAVDVVYASGPDMAALAGLAGCGLQKPLVLEIGDIRRLQVQSGLRGELARSLDRQVLRRCGLLVVTAEQFVETYFVGRLNTRIPTCVIENKLEPGSPPPARHRSISGKRRIGYFGVLRCPWTWRLLEKLAAAAPERVEIVAAGLPLNVPIEEVAAKHGNIRYLGEYQSPADLPELYAGVDMMFAGYPPPDAFGSPWWEAQAICRSNRFYESCCFQTPLICITGSGDAQRVEEWDIGLCVEGRDDEQTVSSILGVTENQLSDWRQNLAQLPRYVFEVEDEPERLGQALRQLVGRPAACEQTSCG